MVNRVRGAVEALGEGLCCSIGANQWTSSKRGDLQTSNFGLTQTSGAMLRMLFISGLQALLLHIQFKSYCKPLETSGDFLGSAGRV